MLKVCVYEFVASFTIGAHTAKQSIFCTLLEFQIKNSFEETADSLTRTQAHVTTFENFERIQVCCSEHLLSECSMCSAPSLDKHVNQLNQLCMLHLPSYPSVSCTSRGGAGASASQPDSRQLSSCQ